MSRKDNNSHFLVFTFLVWVKSVALLLFCSFIFGSMEKSFFLEGSILNIFRLSLLSYTVTFPFFLIMLTVVYFISRTSWTIATQKMIIITIYVLPIIGLSIYLFNIKGDFGPNSEALIVFGLLILIPAVMVYFTKLLPANGQLTSEKKRDDIIDDISFEE